MGNGKKNDNWAWDICTIIDNCANEIKRNSINWHQEDPIQSMSANEMIAIWVQCFCNNDKVLTPY